MSKFIEEFLYTNKPGTGPQWHVVVGETPPEGWDGPPKMHRALRPDQLQKEHGLSLADVMSEMQQEAVKATLAAQARVTELEAELEKVTARADNAERLAEQVSKLVPVGTAKRI